MLVERNNRIQRALQVLQGAKRHSLDPHGDFYQGESMVSNDIGDWVEFDDVAKGIQILMGECSE